MQKKKKIYFCIILYCFLLLSGCQNTAKTLKNNSQKKGQEQSITPKQLKEKEKTPEKHREPPKLLPEPRYQGKIAEEEGEACFDESWLKYGLLGVSGKSNNKLKIQIIKEEEAYTYDLSNDGTPCFFSFTSGNGDYYCRIMENVVDSKYQIMEEKDFKIKLKDEFQPFLHPSQYVNYSKESSCVKKAEELYCTSKNDLETINKIMECLKARFTYDKEKAQTVTVGYIPNLEEIWEEKTGICFDYAALGAAMMRSQGIPSKMIFGYVGDIYHAWNMFYTEETGWVTVEYKVDGKTWTRLDVTFSDGGASDDFIQNGENYTAIHYY